MLAYAADRRKPRQLSPSALALIIGGHAVAIALLISVKMDVPLFPTPVETETYNVPLPPPPPPPEQPRVEPKVQQSQLPPPPDSHVDRPPPIIPTPQPGPSLDSGPALNSSAPDIGPALGDTFVPTPPLPQPKPEIVRVAARSVTPADLLRPPYPESMRRTEEEATLRLRLSIDARGRVTAVEPIGQADSAFVASARSHLIRYWRYRPATEDGKAVASTMVITLRFELED